MGSKEQGNQESSTNKNCEDMFSKTGRELTKSRHYNIVIRSSTIWVKPSWVAVIFVLTL